MHVEQTLRNDPTLFYQLFKASQEKEPQQKQENSVAQAQNNVGSDIVSQFLLELLKGNMESRVDQGSEALLASLSSGTCPQSLLTNIVLSHPLPVNESFKQMWSTRDKGDVIFKLHAEKSQLQCHSIVLLQYEGKLKTAIQQYGKMTYKHSDKFIFESEGDLKYGPLKNMLKFCYLGKDVCWDFSSF